MYKWLPPPGVAHDNNIVTSWSWVKSTILSELVLIPALARTWGKQLQVLVPDLPTEVSRSCIFTPHCLFECVRGNHITIFRDDIIP